MILLCADSESWVLATHPPTLEMISVRRSKESRTAADTRAEILLVDSLIEAIEGSGLGDVWRSSVLADCGEGLLPGFGTDVVRRNLAKAFEALERLDPQPLEEILDADSSLDESPGGGLFEGGGLLECALCGALSS